ncbi:GHKL domain-containing protein [Microbacterium sp. LjRoot45]|uniref:ATP-binding protein n=1 Tax=Microbacterium sp. LjRoot45 TaxID=3342329 RepID=UPI003ECF63EF
MNGAEEIVADIPRHLTALAEWGACLVYVLILGRRWRAGGTILVAAAGLAALLLTQWWAGTLPLALWIPGMLAAAAVMYGFLSAALAVTPLGAGYIAARAFVLGELAASVYWQLDRFYAEEIPPLAQALLCVAVYTVVFALAWAAERGTFGRVDVLRVSGRDLVGAAAITVATFAISNLSFISANTPFSGRFGTEIFYIRTLVDFAGFIALYVQHRVHNEAVVRRDADAMAHLLRSQHEQYELTRRSIDDVNRKYHDMKHHLDALRAEQDAAARSRMVDELEDSIRGYGAVVHTGHHVLDAVLTAKRAYAAENDVEVSYVADGVLLEFLRPLDLTAIVGNAMDNAVQAAARLPSPDQRLVRLALFAQDDFVMLRVENTYDGIVRREGERIVSRQTAEGHGYGLRNIETAATAYGGAVSIVHDERWFSLRILFPRGARRES